MILRFETAEGVEEPVEIPAGPFEVIRREGEIVAVDLEGRRHRVRTASAGGRIFVWCEGETFAFLASVSRRRAKRSGDEAGLLAPMPGKILRALVREGDEVARGATLMILEAMKMEHEIKAPRNGRIAKVPFSAGDQVEAGAVLVEFAP
jgi:3-methylcrotonyl-CoA carboxylase alpha subunit